MAALRNFSGLASWRNAENSLESVNLAVPFRRYSWLNNRAENSHQPFRRHWSASRILIQFECDFRRGPSESNALDLIDEVEMVVVGQYR